MNLSPQPSDDGLPAHSTVALTVLRMIDNPNTCSDSLARAIGADPIFSARVLRAANSPYYGLSAHVGNLQFAVFVLGFHAIRALAVVAATGLDTPHTTPPGFWRAAATTASAGELLAPRLGADPGEAFCLGLLHVLGAVVLHHRQPLPTLCLPQPADAADLLQIEHDRYGISHTDAGAQLLAAWHFPSHLTQLIATHHHAASPDDSPLAATLQVARALTDQLLLDDQPSLADDSLPVLPESLDTGAVNIAALARGRIAVHEIGDLLARVRTRTPHLLASLQSA